MPKKHSQQGEMIGYLGFFDRQGRPLPDSKAWIKKREDPKYNRVASTVLPDGKWVSTVWIGLNYAFGRGPPLIFETMVFSSKDSLDVLEHERHSTEKEALEGHKRLVEKWSS